MSWLVVSASGGLIRWEFQKPAISDSSACVMGGILMSKVNLEALVGRNMISTSDRCNSLLARGARVNIHCFGRDMCCVEIRLDGRSFYL